MYYEMCIRDRAEDVLSMLISVYNENWVKDKNQIAVSTSMFTVSYTHLLPEKG